MVLHKFPSKDVTHFYGGFYIEKTVYIKISTNTMGELKLTKETDQISIFEYYFKNRQIFCNKTQ